MIAGVMIDSWKLPIFKRHLDTAGYKYTEHPGVTADTITLKVTCERVHKVQAVLEAAARECRTQSGSKI
jgi:hypothetical protein